MSEVQFFKKLRKDLVRYSREDIISLATSPHPWRHEWFIKDLGNVYRWQIIEKRGEFNAEQSRELAKLEKTLSRVFRKWSIVWVEIIEDQQSIEKQHLLNIVRKFQQIIPNIYIPKSLADKLIMYRLSLIEN